MPTLPQGITLQSTITAQRQPSLTWRINQETNRIEGTADGLEAVRQAVEIILNVERFRWQIYRPYSGVQWEGLIGQNPGYVASELHRRVAEALQMDDRVRGVSNFAYSIAGNSLTASLTVNTVYGDTQTAVEVTLN